jgi:hypothetical protein
MNRSVCASALIAAALISGCGGGGGGGSDDTTYNARAAWQALATPQSALAIGVTGVASTNDAWIIDLTSVPAGTSTYPRNNTAASSTDDRAVIQVGADTTSSDSTTYYTAPGQVIGVRYFGDGPDPDTCEDVVTTLPPTAASVGDSGPLYTSTEYSSCDLNAGTVLATTTATWSVKSLGSQATTYFCYLEQYRDPSNVPDGSAETCVQVATNGSLGRLVRVTINDPGPPPFSLVATGAP